MIIGCIYRHPSSTMSIKKFSDEIFDLEKISSEDKICALMGDYNIDLLKIDTIYHHIFHTICATTNNIMPKNIN